jgi:uncharacterized protein (DUF58 family)
MRAIFLFLCFYLATSGLSYGEELISGRYEIEGGLIKMELHVKSKTSISVIVNQYLPPGTEIVRSNPKYKSYQKDSGTAKWLLNALEEGSHFIEMETLPEVKPIKGEIICKKPSSSEMIRVEIKP